MINEETKFKDDTECLSTILAFFELMNYGKILDKNYRKPEKSMFKQTPDKG